MMETWNKLADVAAELYETSPRLNDAWERAGGDVARIASFQSPRSAWREGISLLRKGGGGNKDSITVRSLLAVMLSEYPNNASLLSLQRSFEAEIESSDDWRTVAIGFAQSLGKDAREALAVAETDHGDRLLELADADDCPTERKQALLRAAAACKSVQAHFDLGCAFFQPIGVPRSLLTAEVWFRRGAALGDHRCMYFLWKVLDERSRSRESPKPDVRSLQNEAEKFLTMAAQHGFHYARCDLAILRYRSGEKTAQLEGFGLLMGLANDKHTPDIVRRRVREILAGLKENPPR